MEGLMQGPRQPGAWVYREEVPSWNQQAAPVGRNVNKGPEMVGNLIVSRSGPGIWPAHGGLEQSCWARPGTAKGGHLAGGSVRESIPGRAAEPFCRVQCGRERSNLGAVRAPWVVLEPLGMGNGLEEVAGDQCVFEAVCDGQGAEPLSHPHPAGSGAPDP